MADNQVCEWHTYYNNVCSFAQNAFGYLFRKQKTDYSPFRPFRPNHVFNLADAQQQRVELGGAAHKD